jgi:hypothetical protein
MRDIRLVTQHRGGLLTPAQHKQLMKWAYTCAEHVLPFLNTTLDDRLTNALQIAKQWEKGNVTVGDAIKASRDVHTFARESSDVLTIAIARSIGHAVATAHMADHALGAAIYALKAILCVGKSVDWERKWQNKKLSPDIVQLILSTREEKEKMCKELRK